MRFQELRLNHFGKFHNKTLTLKNGINLIYGENEAGKSTIHSFIRGMLFGIEKTRGRASKEDLYTKYQPWDSHGFGGSMDFIAGDKKLRIIRNFDKNNKSTSILDLETGRELTASNQELAALYEGLTEAGFRNTISIEQLKARTDQELAYEVRNYIANLSLTKSKEVDVTKALAYLQAKRKELLARLPGEKQKKLMEEIELGLKAEERKAELKDKLKRAGQEEQLLIKAQEEKYQKLLTDHFPSLDSYAAYLEQFPAIEEKYRTYQDKTRQKKLLTERLQLLPESSSKKQNITSLGIQEGIHKLEEVQKDMTELNKTKETFLSQELDRIKKQDKKKRFVLVTTFLAGCLGVAVSLISGNGLLAPLWSVVIAAGIIYNIQASGKVKAQQEHVRILSEEYANALNSLKTEGINILNQFQAENLIALRKRYEEELRREMEDVHLQKQREEYNRQWSVLNEELKQLNEDIAIYVRGFGNGPLIDAYGRGELEKEAFIDSLREFVAREKRNLVYYNQEGARRLEEIRLKEEKLKWELNQLEGNEESLLENQALAEILIKEEQEINEELQALKLAIETMNRLSVDIHDSFGQELNHVASGLAKEITSGKYGTIKIDEKLNMKVGHEDNYYLIDRFSSGTMEQMYFALRMAVSDILYGKGVMPVLLDDCFALYDDVRTASVLKYLEEKREGQILLFTCHQRERAILDEYNINYHYINLNDGLT
ncbi:hypothetical protein acsn021_01760 [Anaerocolumna cellulosilytica]|uniref:Uncharacterized protein n=1 Tax=Anaerocolumna cellulosilytica TaxID=433286 RepID=A0A6S6QXJ3_9FIRM|nr:AAA family ATPase [Anaerocolumna cellulosilytica]MBB5197920.1 uncharacterized protein YsxB (DUF464 family) [Anaerocolumna cellulosilytica]BCJ92607.1 hypothetical protein acsn021_01760 [Anaerocolumna cellulosilytica]